MAPVRTDSRVGPPRRGIRLRASFACLRICVEMDSSADAPSSRAAFPAPLLSSFAALPTRAANSSRTCVGGSCFCLRLQLDRRFRLELGEGAGLRRFVGPPTHKADPVTEAPILESIERDLADELGSERVPCEGG